ncbi:hypothetical protein [Mesorhizobium sp. B2-3-14]|nr:hypothetical protein [Mesorhizobium sp. B2-3-14]
MVAVGLFDEAGRLAGDALCLTRVLDPRITWLLKLSLRSAGTSEHPLH